MPSTAHVENHFTAGESVRDVVIGMSDGLTVPFALAAGLAGAVASTNIVVVAGLAEITAGSIAMGLGGYLCWRRLKSAVLWRWFWFSLRAGRGSDSLWAVAVADSGSRNAS